MACPVCGGSDRVLVAPGLYRCETVLSRQDRGPGYGAPPTGQYGPEYVTSVGVCATEYQEGPAADRDSPMCACGTFAIGRCVECDAWRCGGCSVMSGGSRFCTTHVLERNATHQRAQERQAASVAAANDQAVAEQRAARDADRATVVGLAKLLSRKGMPGAETLKTGHGFFGMQKVKAYRIGVLNLDSGTGTVSHRTDQGSISSTQTVYVLGTGQFAVTSDGVPRPRLGDVPAEHLEPARSGDGYRRSGLDFAAAAEVMRQAHASS